MTQRNVRCLTSFPSVSSIPRRNVVGHSRMRIERQPFHCGACKHEWIGEMLLNVSIEVWNASMRAMRCPHCGEGPDQIWFGRGFVPDPQPAAAGMTDRERRSAWVSLHDSGASSKCIADVMCGASPGGSYPLDGADFGRCERLLMLYPEWRARLPEMAAVNREWAALVARWDEIVVAWRHDMELVRMGPWVAAAKMDWRCYDLMRAVLKAEHV